ncbi:MAG: rod shape-determining protein [Mariprofundales bacterium]
MSIIHIGIDLGTSHTSVTTSTGARFTCITCVGYAKDIIAKKRFGTDIVFGQKALDNKLALDIVWPLADGIICNDEDTATRAILEHVINASIDKQQGDQIFAAIGVPAQASIKNKQAILAATKGLVDKVIIVSEPFAVAYSIDRFDECLIVDIGAGTTDLCRMHGSIPNAEDQCTLKHAGNFLDETLKLAILDKFPDVQLTNKIIREIKEKHAYAGENSDQILVMLNQKGIPTEYDLTDIMRTSCLQLIQPITQAIGEMIGSFDPDFQHILRHNIIIAGGGSRLKGIDVAVSKCLITYGGGNAECVSDSEFCGSVGALKMSIEMPEEYWEQI